MTHGMEPSGFLIERHSVQALWHWLLLDADGQQTTASATAGDPSPRFASQGDAESWIGEYWRDLVEEGVDSVLLLEGEREVYGPMSLHP